MLFLALAASISWFVADISQGLPDYDALAQYAPPGTTRVYAGSGELVAEYAHERRLYLPIQAIPPQLRDAFIAAEDKNFYQHVGLDYFGIIRALSDNFQRAGSGSNLVGASTITQQLARNILLTRDQTWERKITEGVLALRIEQAYSKDKILELYLNEIPLGLGSYGVAAAALTYFSKAVHELTLPEIALLAAVPKAPSNYDPYRYPERATDRRNYVLDRMVEEGYVTAAEAEAAKKAPLGVKAQRPNPTVFAADYFAEEVRRELAGMYGETMLYEGGLSVRTSLDTTLQPLARKALMNGLVNFDQGTGWRGPVTHIDDLGPDWGVKLAEVQPLRDVVEWRLAVVTAVTATSATIGLQPNKLPGLNAIDAKRETGTVAFTDMRWGVWATGPRRGYALRGANDVVKVGDVIYVEPVAVTPVPTPAAAAALPRISGTGPAPATPAAVSLPPQRFMLRQVPEIQGGLVAMDPHTGRVLALVGGFSFSASQFNRATQAYRQPGSSFKPFVYSAALDNGYLPTSIVLDGPIEIPQGPGLPPWVPENYNEDFLGPSTLRTGIEQSRNVMTVRLAQDLGMPLVAEYAKRFGIVDNMLPYLPLALGAGETTVLRMAAGYSVFANNGKEVKATLIDRIQDRYGKTIYTGDRHTCADCAATTWSNQPEPQLVDNGKQIIDPLTAYQLTSMMEGVVQRGTGVAARVVGKPIAGKTGTTSENRDVWFMGFTPNLVVGVFMGYDNPRQIGSQATGGGLATPIFSEFMKGALANTPAIPFRAPKGITFFPIDLRSGTRATQGAPGSIMEAFKPGTSPREGYSGYSGYPTTAQQQVPTGPVFPPAGGIFGGGFFGR